MPDPLLTTEDLASILATTPAAIRQARHRGSSLVDQVGNTDRLYQGDLTAAGIPTTFTVTG